MEGVPEGLRLWLSAAWGPGGERNAGSRRHRDRRAEFGGGALGLLGWGRGIFFVGVASMVDFFFRGV